MNKLFIFDLDDTLYWNVHDYCYPMLEFEKLVLDCLGHKAPHIGTIRKLEDQIDKQRVPEFGFAMRRFPGSLVETYREICSRSEVPFNQEIANRIYVIGMKAFDPKNYIQKGLVDNAETVLNFLKQQNDELILLTRGDKRVQRIKIEALKLRQWFSQFHIVSSKTRDVFLSIIKDFKGDSVYSVGNSFDSDIKPALKLGLSGIFIPHSTWISREDSKKAVKQLDGHSLFIFKEIKEIKQRYQEL